MCIEETLRNARQHSQGGIKIHGQRISMSRYADDIPVLAESEEDFEAMLLEMDKFMGEGYNMVINKAKTKVMACDKEE